MKSKKAHNKITKELNKIIVDKTELNKQVSIRYEKINEINNTICLFNDISNKLHNELISIEQFENFVNWKDKYDALIIEKNA